MKRLQELSESDFKKLKKCGMLWAFYPDAPENYNEIIKTICDMEIKKMTYTNYKEILAYMYENHKTCEAPWYWFHDSDLPSARIEREAFDMGMLVEILHDGIHINRVRFRRKI